MAEQAGSGNATLAAVANSTGQFATNFYKVVANENPGNLITSPLSAQLILIMAAYGAAGNTATQMRSALFIPSDNELGQSGYRSILESLNDTEGVEFRLANKMYTASRFRVKFSYKELTSRIFSSASQEVDFNDPNAAAAIINRWSTEQTNNRIQNAIDPDSLDADTLMLLVNAVYFKGKWNKEFDPSRTSNRTFHVNETTTKDVPTMISVGKYKLGNLPELDAKFIEIPYQGEKFSMIVILPTKVNGLKKVQDNLGQLNLKQSLQQTRPVQARLRLPQFRIESTLQLKKTLKQLGMTDMFENNADFSGIADGLKVGGVFQKAFIEVNEKGSEAAAVSVVEISARIMIRRVPFFVDRPFYYAIYHHNTGISLFTGVVEEPGRE